MSLLTEGEELSETALTAGTQTVYGFQCSKALRHRITQAFIILTVNLKPSEL